jgi:hypothetical protein
MAGRSCRAGLTLGTLLTRRAVDARLRMRWFMQSSQIRIPKKSNILSAYHGERLMGCSLQGCIGQTLRVQADEKCRPSWISDWHSYCGCYRVHSRSPRTINAVVFPHPDHMRAAAICRSPHSRMKHSARSLSHSWGSLSCAHKRIYRSGRLLGIPLLSLPPGPYLRPCSLLPGTTRTSDGKNKACRFRRFNGTGLLHH